MIFKFKNKKGQGILEVVAAVSVVIIGLLSIVSLAIFNINVQNHNHNVLISSNLAREGIEIIRNVRDSNWLDPEKEWDESLFIEDDLGYKDFNSFIIYTLDHWSNPPEGEVGYSIMPIGAHWKVCVGDGYCKISLLPLNDDPNYKTLSNGGHILEGEDTNFYRIIYINEICDQSGQEKILDGYKDFCKDYGWSKIGMQVISKVGWENRGSIRTVEVEERLYNWK